MLNKDMTTKLIEKILRSEEQIKTGKIVKADTSMKDKDIDRLLMA